MIVRVIGLVATLMMLAVGSWAHFSYYAIVDELHNNNGLPTPDSYGPVDSVWGCFDPVWESFGMGPPDCSADSSTCCPRPAMTSGVQQNPHSLGEE